MNDTTILDIVRDDLKLYQEDGLPMSPASAGRMVSFIAAKRDERRKAEKPIMVGVSEEFVAASNKAGYDVDVVKEHYDWTELSIAREKPPLDATVVEDAALPDWPHEGHPTAVSHPSFREVVAPTPRENNSAATWWDDYFEQRDKKMAERLNSGFEALKDDAKPETPFQNYWRCEHYPIAIENFFKGLEHCVIYGCPSYSVGNGLIHKDQVGDYYLQMTKDWKCDRCGDTRPHGHTL